MRFVSIIGTRPQYIKLAPVHRAFHSLGLRHEYLDSGQHYSDELSGSQIRQLRLPAPLYSLAISEFSPAKQIGVMISQFEPLLRDLKPNCVLVYGDTNTTLAATITAVKLGIMVAHIESGLRSRNWKMQEEKNRIAVDHLADVLFAPTIRAKANLISEGLEHRTIQVGDVMVDQLYAEMPFATPLEMDTLGLKKGEYFVATLHRAENTDVKERLCAVLEGLSNIDAPVLMFAHPRLLKKMSVFGLDWPKNCLVLSPTDHQSILGWISLSKGLITDSGGLQKEAFILRVPCTTLRDETEWEETLRGNWNVLVADPTHLSLFLEREQLEISELPFGNGDTAAKIAEYLRTFG